MNGYKVMIYYSVIIYNTEGSAFDEQESKFTLNFLIFAI